MPRNGSGVYSLPAGNPVVTLTPISSTWANATFTDVATALTGSLATNGTSSMSGQLRLSDGTNTAPALTWATDSTTGWYRDSGNSYRFVFSANPVIEVTDQSTIIRAFGSSAALIVNGVSLQDTLQLFGADIVQVSLKAAASQRASFVMQQNLVTMARMGVDAAHALISDSTNGDLVLSSVAQAIRIGTGGNTGVTVFKVDSAGLVSISRPSGTVALATNSAGTILVSAAATSNTSLQINGPQTGFAVKILGSAISGSSGMQINAGNGTSDLALQVQAQNQGTEFLSIRGDGAVILNANAVTGGFVAAGTLNASGVYVNGIIVASIATITKGSDENRTNNTLANDSVLAYVIPQTGFYRVRVIAKVGSASGTPGIQINLNYSGSFAASNIMGLKIFATGGVVSTANTLNTSPTGGSQSSIAISSSNVTLVEAETIFQATTTGTVGFAWAQLVTNATATTVVRGSVMTIERLG